MLDDPEIYRTVLQRVSVGVYFVDGHRRIVSWNHGSEEFTGYLSQQALGHHMAETFLGHVNHANRRLEGDDLPLNAALCDGQEVDVRHHPPPHGHPVKVRARAEPLRDEFGKLVGAAELIEKRK